MNVTIIYHCGVLEAIKPFYLELNRLGVNVSVIVPKEVLIDPIYSQQSWLRAQDGVVSPLLRMFAVSLIDSRRYNLGFHPGELTRALRLCTPDVIHVFNEYHCFPVTEILFIRNHFLKKKVPVVIYGFQNIDFLKVPSCRCFDFLKKIIRQIIVHYNAKHLQGITAASARAVEILKSYNPSIAGRKIFWGIDLKKFFPRDQKACRQELNLPMERKIIGYFGRMVEEKGIETLLKAVALVNQKEDVLLVLIGEGNFAASISRLSAELKIERNVFYRPTAAAQELNTFYNSLDCFVLASRSRPFWAEQYGRVLIEAMACGIPIAASDSGAIPEVLKDYPQHVLIREGDAQALAAAISRQIKVKSRAVNPRAWDFGMENFAARHKEFYSRVVLDALRE